MELPKDLKYTKDHEWVQVKEDNQIVVGITDYAQEKLGNIVYVELPESDEDYSQGDSCATIESTKAASDVYIPISGKIVEVNEELVDTPELINEDPYDRGWLFVVSMSEPSQLEQLLDADAYRNVIAEEE